MDGVDIILLHEHLNRIAHPVLSQQLEFLGRQIFLDQRPYPHFLQLFADREVWIIDTQLRLVHDDFAFRFRFLRAVEHEKVPWVRDASLELLAKANGIGRLGHSRRVDAQPDEREHLGKFALACLDSLGVPILPHFVCLVDERVDFGFEVFSDLDLVVQVQALFFGGICEAYFVDDEGANGFQWDGGQLEIFGLYLEEGDMSRIR